MISVNNKEYYTTMSRDLVARSEAVRARNKLLESVAGSGFHDNDRDWRGRPVAPHRNGLPRISDHLVPFYGEYDVVFAGKDAGRALAALRAYQGKLAEAYRQAVDSQDFGIVQNFTGTDYKLMRIVPKMAVVESDGVPTLTVRLLEWNDILHALYAEGIGLSGAPLEDTEKRPCPTNEASTSTAAG